MPFNDRPIGIDSINGMDNGLIKWTFPKSDTFAIPCGAILCFISEAELLGT